MSNIGATFGNQIFVQYGPLYLNKVHRTKLTHKIINYRFPPPQQALRMTIRKTGFSAALPFLLAIVMKMIAGPLSDALTLLSDKMRVVLFTSVSQVCVRANLNFPM